MQERYGLNQRPVGRWIGVTIVTILFVAALAYVFVGLTRNSIDSRLVTWDDVAADRVNITFQVRRQATDEVQCVLRAQDEKRNDVGYATVVVPAGQAELVVDYSLRTLAPAYTAELLGCAVGAPPNVTLPAFPAGVVPPDQPYS